jgi:hypothetical protein
MTEATHHAARPAGHAPDIQKIRVKILTDAPPTLNLDPFLSIFGRWRTETEHPAQWVDLADYAHMSRGPGIVLIGHQCNFSFDLGGTSPGILYVSKRGLDGPAEDRLRRVLCNALDLSRRLLAEPEFPPEVRIHSGSLELKFNDRLETPNTDETDRLLRPVVLAVLNRLWPCCGYELLPARDPASLYGFSVRSAQNEPLEQLAARLGH